MRVWRIECQLRLAIAKSEGTPALLPVPKQGKTVKYDGSHLALTHLPFDVTRRTQLQVRHLQPAVPSADDQVFLAPIELEHIADSELKRNERLGGGQATAQALGTDEVVQSAVAATVAVGLNCSNSALAVRKARLGRHASVSSMETSVAT